ncbi:MAG: hypothetical protein K0B81_03510 [Candidatus Cloacimonetes bacterium]|nr:hypothetical protein [Candidatus Cloacimonadota bacterium]
MSIVNRDRLRFFIISFILLFGTLLVYPDLLQKESIEPTLEQRIMQPDELYIGTPFHLHVQIMTAVTQEVYHPIKDTIDVFVINDIKKELSTIDNKQISSFNYRFSAFETGELRLPSLNFEVFDTETSEIINLRTSPVELKVTSVLADTSAVIKDIAGPLRLRLGFWDYLVPLVSLIILVGIVIMFWKKIFQKKELIETAKEQETRPAYQIALELLEDLKQKRLLEKGNYLEYYFQLSFILRFFLELNYKFNAVEMTSSEIKQQINGFPLKERTDLNKFLNETDLVKFAKQVPYVNNALEHTEWLENYLKSYKKRAVIDNAVPEEK